MSKKAKEYSPEFKFKIVKELLRQESTQTEISQREVVQILSASLQPSSRASEKATTDVSVSEPVTILLRTFKAVFFS